MHFVVGFLCFYLKKGGALEVLKPFWSALAGKHGAWLLCRVLVLELSLYLYYLRSKTEM